MNALLFIRDKRKQLEKIETVSLLRMALHADKKSTEKAMERWARIGEIQLTFED